MAPKKLGETSYKQTSFGIIPRSKLIPLEIEGTKRAWDFILRARKKRLLPLTADFIKKVHAVGFGWIFPDQSGKFRTIVVSVSNHTPPAAHEIRLLMKNFILDLKTRLAHLPKNSNPSLPEALTELLAWAHHRFVWIHPFQDYNGRLGRLLINMILLNLDLPPIELKVETKNGRVNYINALNAADGNDYLPLEKIIHAALAEAAKQFSTRS